MKSRIPTRRALGRVAVQTICLLALAGAAGCGGGSSSGGTTTPPPSNPVPSVSSTSPASTTAGGSAFTLTVSGSNFISSSTVQWNGSNRTTTYVSGTQLTAAITVADILTTGTANITVTNPAPGGGTSSAVSFAVKAPVPTLTSVSPSSAVAGGSAFTLTVNGGGFLSSSVIQWNGNSRATSYASATQLTTVISAADIAAGQNAVVTVINPAPGGGTSAEVTFAINTPTPSVASISPSSAAAGSASFTLTVNGSNFLPGSTVQWNGSCGQPPLSTTYVSSAELTVVIPASDITFAGDANVTVLNPAPGGGTSVAAVFTVTGSLPSDVSFVAPNGNDNNLGTIAAPYLTIQKCATAASSGDICAIRAGTYRETVTPNSGITITSYDGEPVTVDGSDPVTGWTLYQGSIYKASVVLSTGDTNQVFVGNQMMTEARWPNGNDLFHGNWATMQAGTTTTQIVDSNLPNINWTGATISQWSGSDPWALQTGVVTASSQGTIQFSGIATGYCPLICPTVGGYYFLSNFLGALDTQQEWYYDPTAGVLYFWAPGNANPSTLNVRAKTRQYAFDLSGQSNVTIEYINLFASTINTNSSSTNNVLDGINAQYVSHFTTTPLTGGDTTGYSSWYTHIEDSGIILNGSGNTLENSTIDWSAGAGVALGGSNNIVENNLIEQTGYVGIFASGITLFGTSDAIQNNTAHTSGRESMELNGFENLHYAINDDISYNNFFNAMVLSHDGGEIHSAVCTVNIANSIDHNWLHDTQLFASPPSATAYTVNGVYIDADSAGFQVYQNVLWNNQLYNILVDGGCVGIANNNLIYNNSIPDIASGGYIDSAFTAPCGTTDFYNNFVLLPISQDITVCPATNNNASAPGATDMTASVHVGCDFMGCSSEGPPVVSGTSVAASIAAQPYNIAVTAGQPVTFTVTGAGSPTLNYQWQRNGTNITGATEASYTMPTTSAADNGAKLTVTVSNSLSSVTSDPAILTVQ